VGAGPGRKRLELAKALAMQPKVLLCDEVMAGLNLVEIDEVIGIKLWLFMTMLPVADSTRDSVRSNVVLPAPLLPTSATISAG
jgi:ABC-type phosphate transport system ATPase subunit